MNYTFINKTFSYISINSQSSTNRKRHIHWTGVWLLNFGQDLMILCLQSRPVNERWTDQWPCLGCRSCTTWRVLYFPARRLLASRCFYLFFWKYFVTKDQQRLFLLLKLIPLTIVTKFVDANYSITVYYFIPHSLGHSIWTILFQ